MATTTMNRTSNRVDRTTGIIRGVKIIGRQSKKGREYSDAALADVARLAEGVVVNIDHVDPGQRRSLRDRAGQMKNITIKGDGVYGDLFLNPGHELFEQICEDAENAPGSLGLSIDALEAKSSMVSGRVIIQSIGKLRSVDLVANPATVDGLYESTDGRERGPFSHLLPSKAMAAARIRKTIERFTKPDPIGF